MNPASLPCKLERGKVQCTEKRNYILTIGFRDSFLVKDAQDDMAGSIKRFKA